ncbi:MAG: amidohydrolase family protein [Planctomycetes bacterium]|nr:amidohydrolase family protein [Planctomycetota bacterium]
MCYHELYARAAGTPVVETHEHQLAEKRRIDDNLGWRILLDGYAVSNLVSAGMDPAWWNAGAPCLDPIELWRAVEPFFRACEHSSYLKAVKFSAAKCYGVSVWNDETVAVLERKVKASHAPGVNRRIFRDLANVDHYHVNALEDEPFVLIREDDDPELVEYDLSTLGFSTVPYLGPDAARRLGSALGIEVGSLDHFIKAVDLSFDKYASSAIAVKNQAAYTRNLAFRERSLDDVRPLFDDGFLKRAALSPMEKEIISDWLFCYTVQKSADAGLVVKIHTGYLAGTGYMNTSAVDPTLLEPLFRAYPSCRFDLFHVGYPFVDKMVSLVKHYPNVYADMCWAWALDWEAAKRFLKQAITALPHTRIFAAGGDTFHAENAVGHLEMARRGVAAALSELVDEHYLGGSEALALVDRLLRDNQLDVFGRKRTSSNRYA